MTFVLRSSYTLVFFIRDAYISQSSREEFSVHMLSFAMATVLTLDVICPDWAQALFACDAWEKPKRCENEKKKNGLHEYWSPRILFTANPPGVVELGRDTIPGSVGTCVERRLLSGWLAFKSQKASTPDAKAMLASVIPSKMATTSVRFPMEMEGPRGSSSGSPVEYNETHKFIHLHRPDVVIYTR